MNRTKEEWDRIDELNAYDEETARMERQADRDRIAELEAQVAKLRGALAGVASSVCSWLCVSQWRSADGYPGHHESCNNVRTALDHKTEPK